MGPAADLAAGARRVSGPRGQGKIALRRNMCQQEVRMSSTNGSKTQRAITALGESALTGVRGKAGRAVAKPIAERTRFTEEQVEVAIGLAIVVYGLYRVLRPAFRAMRAA
jgi:hypothetical protein